MAPATVIPPTRSAVRPGVAWRARIDCTLDSGISTYSPSTNPERVSVMTWGDRSRRVLLSVLVTQTVLGAFKGMYSAGECTGTTVLHAVTRGTSGNRMGAVRRRHIASSGGRKRPPLQVPPLLDLRKAAFGFALADGRFGGSEGNP